MFRSIADEVRGQFNYSNMMVKLIIINVAVFVVTAIVEAFAPTFYGQILPYIALPGDLEQLLYRPWTLVTHMFLHSGLWHLIYNMLIFHLFGRILGDLLGDQRVLPVYILGGLVGAGFYILSFYLVSGIGSIAMGASAAILAIVFAAVSTAPDYKINLILIGEVSIKYIGLVILFLDIIGSAKDVNQGGHIAHLGGTLFGFLFIYGIRNGVDLAEYFNRFISFFDFEERRNKKLRAQRQKSPLKVAHRSERIPSKPESMQSKVDTILEKIKTAGYNSLTDEEKDVLYQASKN